jgi:hypothetical protein
VDPYDQDLIDFALMVDMGFFTLTESHYQMTIPHGLGLQGVKKAHLKLAETKDAEWIHPERHLVLIAHEKLKEVRRQLVAMSRSDRARRRLDLLPAK